MAKILAFAGSARRDSFNRKLIRIAVDGARAGGGEVTLLDLADYPMPLYDGDLEASDGLPANAVKLRQIFGAHSALLIASPEYNSSVSPLLKNTIDWVSRPTKDEAGLKYISGKVAGLVAASPGALGGLRGLVHVRAILGNIGVTVIPQQHAVSGAANAFDGDKLKDEGQTKAVMAVGQKLAEVAAKLA